MKLWVQLEDSVFQNYIETKNLPNCPETFQRYLTEIGTLQISFQSRQDYVLVPPGSCIRLRTSHSYNAVKQQHSERLVRQRRTSSCSLM